MKSKKLLVILSLFIVLSLVFTACTEKAQNTAATTTTEQSDSSDEMEAEITSIESEDISFYDAKDSKGNTLKLSPIYAKDGKTVIAAYVISVTDSKGKALDANAFTLLNCVVRASSDTKSITLTEDKNKELIKILSYADEKGNLLAIQDVSDSNGNKNTTEYLKLNKKTNEHGSTHYFLTDTVIEIKTENKKTVAVENGKKTVVKSVDSSNKTVSKTVTDQTKSTDGLEDKTTTKPAETTTKKPSSSGSDGNTTTAAPSDEKTYESIVLLKNGKASSSSSGVTLDSNEVKITKGGNYKITSETDLWHGVIKVELKNTEEAELRFEDVDISYNKGSIIQLIDASETFDRSFLEAEATAGTVADDAIEELSERTSAPDVMLTFPTGTSSSFTDSANIYTGVLYNESKLTFKGNGKATFKASTNANNAISSSKSITIKNLNLNLETTANTATSSLGGAKGIFSYSKITLESGNLNIASNGDAIRCDSFYQEGGSANIESSACDGIDVDDALVISGGKTNVTAIQKSALKVRRVNNQERYDKMVASGQAVSAVYKKQCIRDGKGDTFDINGGTVSAESYKMSTPRTSSKQNVILCKATKSTKGNVEESKKAVSWNISGLASSNSKSVKFLYSSGNVVNKKEYTVKVDGAQKDASWTWNGGIGVAKVISVS